jgi:hypothetical protein
VLDLWLEDLSLREKEHSIAPGTGRVNRSLVKVLRAEFGTVLSDRLDHRRVNTWRGTLADEITAKRIGASHANNLIALLKQIVTWAQHPERRPESRRRSTPCSAAAKGAAVPGD